jgi:hypothetical protein
VHLLDERQAADAGADDDADAVLVFVLQIEAGVLDGHRRGGEGVVDEGVRLLDLFPVDPFLGLEAAYLSGDARGELAGVELGDAIDARSSFDQSLPRRLVADAERRDHSKAGHDDATSVQEIGSFNE